jgi:hypothetical protein
VEYGRRVRLTITPPSVRWPVTGIRLLHLNLYLCPCEVNQKELALAAFSCSAAVQEQLSVLTEEAWTLVVGV